MSTTYSARNPYQFESAEAGVAYHHDEVEQGMQPVTGEVRGMAADRYRSRGEFHHPYRQRNLVNVGERERVASAVAAVACGLYGFKSHGLARGALFAAAGALAFRSATGHCPVKRMLNRNSAQ